MVFLRSTLFFVLSIVNTVFFGLFTLPASLIHARAGYECARTWGRVELWMATYVCGMRYRIAGLENIPNHPCISMAKHQSAWETIFILCHIPRAVWIIKKELVWLPVVG
ncbi:MAG TPA: 1-acyl-sn-glycerol-3-phosphate acyltransferase, partial [Usitatibacteraceae bacterium]|nr:1-acyl-sn-glycerol-3-phosphate acyltransferase [Usitatibacteraceae bacterium]